MSLIHDVFGRVEYHYSREYLGTSCSEIVIELQPITWAEVRAAANRLLDMKLVEYNATGDMIPTEKGLAALRNGSLRSMLR